MMKIMEALVLDGNTLPIVFLRYNPNAYRVNGLVCKTTKKSERTDF
jgi:hypothetical protein